MPFVKFQLSVLPQFAASYETDQLYSGVLNCPVKSVVFVTIEFNGAHTASSLNSKDGINTGSINIS